jgi:hypothetical protein
MYFYLLMGNGICCAAARKIYIEIGTEKVSEKKTVRVGAPTAGMTRIGQSFGRCNQSIVF